MAIVPKPIFQTVPAGVVAFELYTPAEDVTARIESIVFVNIHTSSVLISIFHDIDGAEFDDASLILKEVSIAPDDRYVFDERVLMDWNGSLGIQVSVADVVSVTGYAWVDQ